MGLTDRLATWLTGLDPAAVADSVRLRVEEAGPPPVVLRLPPRERGAFDRLVGALDRLPRPVLTWATLALFAAAVVAPDWFTARMTTLAQLPDSVWWGLGAVLGLHVGARAQSHVEEARRDAVAGAVEAALAPPPPPRAGTPSAAAPGADAALTLGTLATGPNAALAEWAATRA